MPFIFGLDVIPRMTRLQIKRLHAGYSIAELASRSGVSVQTIEKHEQGIRSNYTARTVQRLAGVLAVNGISLVRVLSDIWEGDGKLWWRDFSGSWREIPTPQITTPWTTTVTDTTIHWTTV